MKERPGCEHCQQQGEPSPRTIDGHEFALDWREHPGGGGWEQWRWLCSCSTRRRGQWTAQSDSVAYHAWLKHVAKARAEAALMAWTPEDPGHRDDRDHPEAWFSPSEGYIVRSLRSDPDRKPPLVRVSNRHVVHELPPDAVRLVPQKLV